MGDGHRRKRGRQRHRADHQEPADDKLGALSLPTWLDASSLGPPGPASQHLAPQESERGAPRCPAVASRGRPSSVTAPGAVGCEHRRRPLTAEPARSATVHPPAPAAGA